MKSTISPKPAEIERAWYVVDGADVPVGRLSTTVAKLLLGKGKPIYAPHVDCGDFVIVLNAEKVQLTGGKEEAKIYYRHTTQQPGSLKSPKAREVRAKHPTRLVENAVFGMLPKTKLGRKIRKKLKVYVGAAHPHQAQKPQALDLAGVKM
jgi:large subunit ribosomal protein L13